LGGISYRKESGMKIRYAVLALALAVPAYGQEYGFGRDVTPGQQLEINRQNDLKNVLRRAEQEAERAKAEQRAAELRRQMLQAQSDAERARIQAQADIEAAKNRQPDVCLNCNLWR
jgi:hypothetical protein